MFNKHLLQHPKCLINVISCILNLHIKHWYFFGVFCCPIFLISRFLKFKRKKTPITRKKSQLPMKKMGNWRFFTFKRQFVVKLEKLDNAKYTLKLSVNTRFCIMVWQRLFYIYIYSVWYYMSLETSFFKASLNAIFLKIKCNWYYKICLRKISINIL